MARIILGSSGPDHQDTGPLARALRDAGHEVVLGGGGDPASLAAAVVQEDAELVVRVGGTLQELTAALAERGVDDVPATVVGPDDGVAVVRWAAAYDG